MKNIILGYLTQFLAIKKTHLFRKNSSLDEKHYSWLFYNILDYVEKQYSATIVVRIQKSFFTKGSNNWVKQLMNSTFV